MKFSRALLLALSSVARSRPAAADLRGDGDVAASRPRRRVLQEDTKGTFLAECITGDDGRRGMSYGVELADGSIYEVVGANDHWMDDLQSGVDALSIGAGAEVRGAKVDVSGGRLAALPGASNPFGRRLQYAKEGTKTVLVVRVVHVGTDNDALRKINGQYAPVGTMEDLRRDIFGAAAGLNDPANLHSQFLACSHGKLNFQPLGDRESKSAAVTNVEDGVVEVQVRTNCNDYCADEILNDVNEAIKAAFDVLSIRYIANHVMHCMPDGSWDGSARASINGWRSYYRNDRCQRVFIQLHELGHNLGLHHSSEGNGESRDFEEYGDYSGAMGSYRIGDDDDRYVCFNNAKIWQLGWMPEAMKVMNVNQGYSGPLKGQINYLGQSGEDPIVIQIRSHVDDTNYYVGYNHAYGHNRDTEEGRNQVTIQRYAGTGPSFSYLVAKLSAGRSWSVNIGDVDLTVEVRSIDTSPKGVAQVDISFGSCRDDSNCDDGLACNGVETCDVDGIVGFCRPGNPLSGCCGNGVCEDGEDTVNCAADCPPRVLTTRFDGAYPFAQGNVFEVRAVRDLKVVGFRIHVSENDDGSTQVWDRAGGYAGFQDSSNGWTRAMQYTSTKGAESGQFTELPRLDQPISIAAGATHSFHIFRYKGLLDTPDSSKEGDVLAQNDGELIVYTGRGCWRRFTCPYEDRAANIEILYKLEAEWTFTTRAGLVKKCPWVGFKPDLRCGKIGDNGVVASEACPQECASYTDSSLDRCENDPNWSHTTPDGKVKYCAWVGYKSQRCNRDGQVGNQDVVAREACPEECDPGCS